MNSGVDTGEAIGQYETQIGPNETYESLRDRLAQLGALMIRDLLPYYTSEEIKPEPQSQEGASQAPKFTPAAGEIKPTDTPEEANRKVRALSLEPGAYIMWNGKRIKILASHLEDGQFVIDVLHLEGSKPMTWKEFHNGHPNFSLPSKLSSPKTTKS